MNAVYDIKLVHDSDGTVQSWKLVLDDDFGTHEFVVDPAMLDEALREWRYAELEAEVVRRERASAGGVSWQAYRDGFACHDPEGSYVEMLAEQADLARKREREGAIVDPADTTDYLDAA